MTPILLSGPAFLIALGCAVLMGYAIQRGATCMVAAIDEVVAKRRVSRLIALAEAAVWVAGGLLVAHLVGGLAMQPVGHPATLETVVGGLLLGLGALLNRACVFGAIARLGSGEWAYALTPVGFFIGCLTIGPVVAAAVPDAALGQSPLFAIGLWLLAPLVIFVAWRSFELFRASRGGALAAHIWSPHRATTVIGIAFVVMMVSVGAWAYTDALAQLARGMAENSLAKIILFAGLLLGALIGGWTAERLRHIRPSSRSLVRCFAGGVLMAWGSLLIPGGNDGLILVGLPLLQPQALVALACMALAIAAGLIAERRFLAR